MIKDYKKLASETELGKVKIISNYHTHNYLCGHASGTVSDYAKIAVENGLKTLGVSDHCSAPFCNMPTAHPFDEFFSLYLPQFDEACAEYGKQITILKGAETEFFEGHNEFYEELLARLDYLVLGQHEFTVGDRFVSPYSDLDEASISAYMATVRKGLKSGYFSVLAHPDLIFRNATKISKKNAIEFEALIECAVKCDIAVELNANGIRSHEFRYPTDLLVSACEKYGAKVVVSSDAHSPEALCDGYMKSLLAYARARKLNVVDNINLKRN